MPIPAWALIVCALLVIISMIVKRKVLPDLMKKDQADTLTYTKNELILKSK